MIFPSCSRVFILFHIFTLHHWFRSQIKCAVVATLSIYLTVNVIENIQSVLYLHHRRKNIPKYGSMQTVINIQYIPYSDPESEFYYLKLRLHNTHQFSYITRRKQTDFVIAAIRVRRRMAASFCAFQSTKSHILLSYLWRTLCGKPTRILLDYSDTNRFYPQWIQCQSNGTALANINLQFICYLSRKFNADIVFRLLIISTLLAINYKIYVALLVVQELIIPNN